MSDSNENSAGSDEHVQIPKEKEKPTAAELPEKEAQSSPVVQVTGLPKGPGQRGDLCWGRRPQVLALIKYVEEFFEEFYDDTRKKKTIWDAIGKKMQEEGYSCTGTDCYKKWRNLKSTYARVLQKERAGDKSYRFEYFDALHHILGREISPLLTKEEILSSTYSPEYDEKMEIFKDITVDGNFVWTDEAVYFLLHTLSDRLDSFDSPDTVIEGLWEEIAQHLSLEGHEVDGKMCQRKWLALHRGFLHYQTQAEASGTVPLWRFFTRVRDIIRANSVITTISANQADLIPNKNPSYLNTSSLRKVRPVDYPKPRNLNILSRVKKMETQINITRRVEHLESRMDAALTKKEVFQDTNTLLAQLLTELQTINDRLEKEIQLADTVAEGKTLHVQHHSRSASPDQGIIYVEAFSADEL